MQDSWRYSFFALGRGSKAFLNDLTWAAALVPALLVLRATGHADVFWYVFAWGAAAAAGAAVGPLQARVIPGFRRRGSGYRSIVIWGLATWRRTPPTVARPRCACTVSGSS